MMTWPEWAGVAALLFVAAWISALLLVWVCDDSDPPPPEEQQISYTLSVEEIAGLERWECLGLWHDFWSATRWLEEERLYVEALTPPSLEYVDDLVEARDRYDMYRSELLFARANVLDHHQAIQSLLDEHPHLRELVIRDSPGPNWDPIFSYCFRRTDSGEAKAQLAAPSP